MQEADKSLITFSAANFSMVSCNWAIAAWVCCVCCSICSFISWSSWWADRLLPAGGNDPLPLPPLPPLLRASLWGDEYVSADIWLKNNHNEGKTSRSFVNVLKIQFVFFRPETVSRSNWIMKYLNSVNK